MLLIAAVTWLAEKAVLAGIDLRDEIDNQQNLGISVTQAGLTIAVGILSARGTGDEEADEDYECEEETLLYTSPVDNLDEIKIF